MKIESGYAILDVKRGRKALEKEIKKKRKVPVIITGEIDDVYSGYDDGVSLEFTVIVKKVEVQK